MSHALFEMVENFGFIKGTTINTEQIARASRITLCDTAVQSAELTTASFISNEDSIFSHTASLSLSGGPLPIYKDVIEPELAYLNQKVNSASKSLFKKTRAEVLGWVAAISAGHYFGFLDSGLIAIAKALGLVKVAADLTAGLMASPGEDAIRDENMYFLWKVRHRAEHG